MPINKKDREIIFNKYGGRCAYCGCELNKGWCVDHLEPIIRSSHVKYESGKRVLNEYGQAAIEKYITHPEKDTIENMMPSCASCNNYKSTYGLELFRGQIGLLVERLNKTFTQYKIAKRFGLVVETKKQVEFYYELFELEK